MEKPKESHSDQMIDRMNLDRQEDFRKSKEKEKKMIKQIDHLESLRRGKSKY